MGAFRPFEAEVLRHLVGHRLTEIELAELLRAEVPGSYEHSGSGYFVTIPYTGSTLPTGTYSSPAVIGRAGDLVGGFVVFVADGELTLECHSWGGVDLPEDFRERGVEVGVTG